jgi:hypothetical protein
VRGLEIRLKSVSIPVARAKEKLRINEKTHLNMLYLMPDLGCGWGAENRTELRGKCAFVPEPTAPSAVPGVSPGRGY